MKELFDGPLERMRSALGLTMSSLILVAVAVGVALLMRRVALRTIRNTVGSTRAGSVTLFETAAKVGIWLLLAAFIAEFVFNVEVGSLFAALGVGSLFLSLGLQDLIRNVVSGMEIVTNGLIKPGDQIEVGAYRGEVLDISWRQTVIRDHDGDPIAIPNSMFNTQTVLRRDGHMAARHEMSVEVRPGIDLDEARVELEAIARDALLGAGVKHPDLDPRVRFLGATAYGAQASVRLYVDDIEHRTAAFDAAMRAFSRSGYLSNAANNGGLVDE